VNSKVKVQRMLLETAFTVEWVAAFHCCFITGKKAREYGHQCNNIYFYFQLETQNFR
jgi:hypothetical protein